MKKKLVMFAALVLVVVTCLSVFVGCDSSARNVKYLGCDDFLHETGVSVTMTRRLKKVGKWNSTLDAIKFDKSFADLFDLMQMPDGYVKTLHEGYILIEKQGADKLYTWGIFSTSVWLDYDGEYQYVLTAMDCVVVESHYVCVFFFPIYVMKYPTLDWEQDARYAANVTIDELAEFYTQHGFTAVILDNIITVTTPIENDFYGNDRSSSWEITFHGDGTVSVGNFSPI